MTAVVLATSSVLSGGVWRHVLELGTGLAARGWKVTVAGEGSALELRTRASKAGLGWAPLPGPRPAAETIFHLHLHDTYERAALPLLARRRLHGPTVVTEHLPRTNASDPRLLPGSRRRGAHLVKTHFKRVQARFASRIIALSSGSRGFLLERYRLAPGPIEVVPNGVAAGPDPAASEPPGEAMRVLSVGSLGMQKGHDVLIRAAALARQRWEATVLGEGAGRERLECLLANVGAARVTLAGWSDDVARELERAAAVCLPSRWEACPYAALDAMAAGRALVGSEVDGLADLVLDGETGLLVAPDIPRQLAAALDRLAEDADERARMGRAGRRRALDSFSLERMVSRTETVYEAARRGGAR